MLGKNTLLYLVGTILRYSTLIILIPIYTSALTPAEYGALETLTVVQQTLLILVGLGLSNSIVRFYSECEDEREVSVVIRTASVVISVIAIVVFAALLPFVNEIGQILLKEESKDVYIILIIVWSIGVVLNELLFAYYRAGQNARIYVILSAYLFITILILNISLIHIFDLGILGILLGNLIAVWGLNCWLVMRFWWRDRNISRSWAKILLTFGLPFVIARFCWLLLNSADRYFLAYYRDLSEVGMYGLGYRSGLIVMIIVIVPFQLAWGPYVFSRSAEHKKTSVPDFSRSFTYLMFAFALVSLLLIMFSKEIVRFLGSGKFPTAAYVVPFVLLAYLFSAVYFWSGSFFHLKKKTWLLSMILVGGALLNLGLNRLMVPRYGWIGAALVTVITIGGVGLVTLFIGYRFYPVPIQIGRLFKLFLCFAAMLAIYLILPIPDTLIGWIERLIIFVAFLIGLYIIGFFENSELKLMTDSLRLIKRKFRVVFVGSV
jgi:O-antigen/teichoic acid export membrane protein